MKTIKDFVRKVYGIPDNEPIPKVAFVTVLGLLIIFIIFYLLGMAVFN